MCGYILEKKNDTVLDSEKQETFVQFIVETELSILQRQQSHI